ncbi:MAG: diaminopimelate decarboxylase, partial [Muribaculaceae bacterium]|nr:diaminopimelate decarboxylase [Muribaculaceae bacterium]
MNYRTIFPISEFSATPTPFYYYDMELLRRTLDSIRHEIPAHDQTYQVHYAIKANANPLLLQTIAKYGFGADCVSGGEIQAALGNGFTASKIVYAGVGKTDDEISLGLDAGISCFNVESLPELEVIDMIAASKNIVAKVAVRINPNIDAHTHHYITTGLEENKFGINLDNLPELIRRCIELKNVELIGLHFHIGSQILTMEPYRLLCERINSL